MKAINDGRKFIASATTEITNTKTTPGKDMLNNSFV